MGCHITVWNKLHGTEEDPGVTLWYMGGFSFQVICVSAEGVKDELIIFALVKLHRIYSYLNLLQKCVLEWLLTVSVCGDRTLCKQKLSQ